MITLRRHEQRPRTVRSYAARRGWRACGKSTYAYDALDRLVDARGREHTGTFEEPEGGFGVRRQRNVPYGRGPHAHPNDGTALRRYTQVFTYDAVGNLAEVVHHQGNLGTVLSRRTYRYTDNSGSVVDAEAAEPFAPLFNNQLASTVVGSNTYAYEYDEHGNMDLPHLVDQSWSPLDRLHSIQATAAWASDGDSPTALDPTEDHDWFYVYAVDGQRARKVRAVGTSGATRSQERFYLGSFEVWREYATNATETTAGVPETERETWHVHDDTGRMAMVETKTWSAGSVVSSPVPRWRLQIDDHLGTATGEVTEAGAIISYEEFHAYGTTAFQAVDGSIDVSRKRYRYTGMERDDETGLHYHHHRYYAPWLGRWTSADPAGLVDGVNRWQYGRAGPTTATDLSGLDPVRDRVTSEDASQSQTRAANPAYATTPFSGSGANPGTPAPSGAASNVETKDMPGLAWGLWSRFISGKPVYTEGFGKFSNPLTNPEGPSPESYARNLDPLEAQRQVRLILDSPVSGGGYIGLGQWPLGPLDTSPPTRREIIVRAATHFNLPPELVAAVILAEQRDQSEAEDIAGAIKEITFGKPASHGLGQLTSTTARAELTRMGLGVYANLPAEGIVQALFDEEVNIWLTAAHIRTKANELATLPEARQSELNRDFSPPPNYATFSSSGQSWGDAEVILLGAAYTSDVTTGELVIDHGRAVLEALAHVRRYGGSF